MSIQARREESFISPLEVRTVDPIRRGLRPFWANRLSAARQVRTVDPIRRGLRQSQQYSNQAWYSFVRTVDPIRRGLRRGSQAKA